MTEFTLVIPNWLGWILAAMLVLQISNATLALVEHYLRRQIDKRQQVMSVATRRILELLAKCPGCGRAFTDWPLPGRCPDCDHPILDKGIDGA